MLIPLSEPNNFRYIRINPSTNRIHLLVPFIAGFDISTDNTCKSDVELKAFFEAGAFKELESYKSTLEFHISILEEGGVREAKKERLAQINLYLEAVIGMKNNYKDIVKNLLSKPSNLYSIQLRPRNQDFYSRVVNPVFTINRSNDNRGTPLSPLYNRMHGLFADAVIGAIDPKSRLTQAVLRALPPSPTFQNIQKVLHEQCQVLFGINVDFDHYFKRIANKFEKIAATQASVSAESGFGEDPSPEEYIDGLLYLCAENLWIDIPTSAFYKVSNVAEDLSATQKKKAIAEKTECLSILTQFFLANVNVYCRSKNISTTNFGIILDNSSELSDELAAIVLTALSTGVDVEDCISHFFNAHAAEFGLTRPLNSDEITAIKQKFASTYQAVTTTKENPHMDDFMILDTDAQGENDIFITSKGLICTDFSNIAPTNTQNQHYFAEVRDEARTHRDNTVTPQDEPIIKIDIAPEALLNKLDKVQWERLPKEIVEALKFHKFLDDVAKGKQDEANHLLQSSDDIQILLRTPGKFTDYSGRTFHCTAYEYAYWAKDTHMQRMLERHMDNETKALMLEKIDEIECSGLAYHQHGLAYQNPHYDMSFVLKNLSLKEFYQLQKIVGKSSSKIQQATADNYQKTPFSATEFETLKKTLKQHRTKGMFSFFSTSPAKAISGKLQFDFHSLITELNTYLTNYDQWTTPEREMAWIVVGKAQRDVPAHIAHEYCKPNRTFDDPWPLLNEKNLPRLLTFDNYLTNDKSWFPLSSSSSGLGFDFALSRAWAMRPVARLCTPPWLNLDLATIRRLDKIRIADLAQSRENLSRPASQTVLVF